jgi:tRNA threonylcarbamoyladenosine biosynthesis protein TsaE
MGRIALRTEGERQTLAAGKRLGKLLKPGDIICLYGELGSGKTVLVKGIASALGISEKEITSASFIIAAEHSGRKGTPPLTHLDLYRLAPAGGRPGEEEDRFLAEVEEYFHPDGITVIEWAERFSDKIECTVRVRLNIVSSTGREIIIEGINEKDWDNLQGRERGAG